MTDPRHLWVVTLLAALAGLSLGLGTVVIAERAALEAGPPGWNQAEKKLPLALSKLVGPPAMPGDGWSLASHTVWSAPEADLAELTVEARLPKSGHLDLRLGGGPGRSSVALLLDRGSGPYAMVVVLREDANGSTQSMPVPQPVSCDTELPAPHEDDVVATLARGEGEVVATVTTGGITTTARCPFGSPLKQGASVRSGLRRIGLKAVSTPSLRLVAPQPSWLFRAMVGLLGALGLAGCARTSVRRGWVGPGLAIVGVMPLLAVLPLSFADLVSALQAVRVVPAQPLLTAIAGPVLASSSVWFFAQSAALARSRHTLRPAVAGVSGVVLGGIALPGYGALGLLVMPLAGLAAVVVARLLPGKLGRGPLPGMVLGALAGLLIVAALAPIHGMAVTYGGVVGVCLAALVWVNVARPRGWNPASLLLFVLVAFFADQALRWTALGMRLTGQSARSAPHAADELGGTFSSFEALEHRREWQDYPLQDYPVAPPDRRPATTRILAMGGSSTGGAWQNDNLDQFWPAALERKLGGGHQVVNLGVGGWTTFHIRRFLETRLEVADPDLVVLYVGHNDILTFSPRPYNDLYAAWQAGGQADLAVSGALSRVPLYQLARFGLQAASGRASSSAVPLSDARDNLLDIIALLEPSGARLLLTREAIAPDPSALAPYGEMLAELARSHDSVGYVDIASQLSGPRGGGAFIDDCHLTDVGHDRVAAAVRVGLTAEGWLPPVPGR